MIGVLVDIVVLNLFVEFVDNVVIDSFAVTILTAFVIRLLLQATLALEHRSAEPCDALRGLLDRVLRVGSAWLIMFASEFTILEVIDVIFDEHTELGEFLVVLGLAAAMIVAEKTMRLVYNRL